VRRFLACVAAVVSLLPLSACGHQNTSSNPESGYISGNGSTQYITVAKRTVQVALNGKTLEGKSFSLSSLDHQVVVVNIWASWCAPCRAEATALTNVHTQFAGKHVSFVGINTRDSTAAALAFTKRFTTGYPSLQDADGVLTLAFGNLGPSATPSTIILDAKHRVAARILGEVTEAELRSVVRAVLQDGV
jgi:thiol-disulfide isomerase/thioredoxin